MAESTRAANTATGTEPPTPAVEKQQDSRQSNYVNVAHMIYGYKTQENNNAGGTSMQAKMRKNLEKACFNRNEKGKPILSLRD